MSSVPPEEGICVRALTLAVTRAKSSTCKVPDFVQETSDAVQACLNWRVPVKLQMDKIHSTGRYKLLRLPAGASYGTVLLLS